MSFETRNKNYYQRCIMNSTSIVFDRRYFTGSFRRMVLLVTVKSNPADTSFE